MSMNHREIEHRNKLTAASEIDDRFRIIFDAVSDGIFLSDPATGHFTEVNAAACQMFGYLKADLIGRGVNELSSGVPPHTHEAALALNERARLGEPQLFEWQCKTREGALFWVEISLRYVELDHVPTIVATIRDVSLRKRLDTELKLALRKISAASDAKSAFLANMSHELRTPLNAIIGFSDLMRSQLLGPLGRPRYREYVDDIHSSGLHLLSLINDVLDLSRLDAGMATLVEREVSLRNVADEACKMVATQAKKADARLTIKVPIDLPNVLGDERRIKQIIVNLLSNAIKFTPGPGIITVEMEEAASGILLKVIDNGIGICEADLPKVFERFGQVDNELSRMHDGTGLGLPLVKQLIELHGGSLAAESKLGVGTTITVAFPMNRIIKPANSVAA